jgi:hypothetical protein
MAARALSSSFRLLLKKSKIPILDFDWFIEFTRIEEFIEKLDHFFSTKLNDADTDTDESLGND